MTLLARNLRSKSWHRWNGERSPCNLLTDWTRNEVLDSSTFTDEEIVDVQLCGHCFRRIKMNESQKPMTVAEVDDLLKSTLHGPPPQKTIYRMFATLAEWKGDRGTLQSIKDYIDSICIKHVSECPPGTEILFKLNKIINKEA